MSLTQAPAGHGRWECLHGLLLRQCRCPHFGVLPRIVPCEEIPEHQSKVEALGVIAAPDCPGVEPVEPCGDPNPWGSAGGPTHGPFPPCGRPKGHDTNGGKGGQWGKGHSEKPSDDDPPVKAWRQTWTSY